MKFSTFIFVLFTGLYLEAIFFQMLRLYSLKRPVPENVSDMYGQRSYERWIKCQRHLIRFSITRFSTYYALFLMLLFFDISPLFTFDSFGSTLLRAALYGMIALCCFLVPAFRISIRNKYGLSQQNAKELVHYGLLSFISFFVSCIIFETFIPIQFRDNALNTSVSLPKAIFFCLLFFAIRNIIHSTKQYKRCFVILDRNLLCELHQLAQASGVSNIEFHRIFCGSDNMDAGIFRFFSRKVIMFSNALITSLDIDSICAIAAHEIGHAAHKHIVSTNILKAACASGAIALAWSFFNFLFTYASLSEQQQTLYSICLLLEILIGIPLCIIIKNKICQAEELQADTYAARTKYGKVYANALKQSEKKSIQELNPHPLLLLLTSDHPPLWQRIVNIEKELNRCNQNQSS